MLGFYNYTMIPSVLSMFCGVLSVAFATSGSPLGSVLFLMIAGAIDVFDGKIATTKELNMAEKRFGYITDALGDMICYGLVPVIVAFVTNPLLWWQATLLALYPVAVMIRLAYVCVCQEARLAQGSPKFRYYEGFPISYISLILPLIYLIHSIDTVLFSWVYFIVLLALIPLMLIKFRIAKPRFKVSLYILGFGILEMTLLLIFGKN
ncbi:MAG: hypothetical protein J6Z00_00265 [Clostridia bacterium]|nr:hypothetical protein [Clostridia bacterium]